MTTTKNCLYDDKKNKKIKKGIREHRAHAHAAAKANAQKPNAAARRERNRSRKPKKNAVLRLNKRK